MSTELAMKHCDPRRVGETPLPTALQEDFLQQLRQGWRIVDGHHLERELRFTSYPTALAFVNAVADEAEFQDHHPEILLAYGRVKIEIYTHTVDGLSENDFILAARIDALARF
jgi:4a-hydroxytetrahydrobiopterin dehydratase